jgi:hypothetical protein
MPARSVAEGIAQVGPSDTQSLSVEHPTGEFTVNLELDRTGALPVVKRAGLLRTARLLFDGLALPHPDYLTLAQATARKWRLRRAAQLRPAPQPQRPRGSRRLAGRSAHRAARLAPGTARGRRQPGSTPAVWERSEGQVCSGPVRTPRPADAELIKLLPGAP